jgi:CheY-like chemotaxis protein
MEGAYTHAPPSGDTPRLAVAASRGSVLVVDDDATLLHLIEMILGDEGYRVATAGTLAEALDALAHVRFDVVLADTMGAPLIHEGAEGWAGLEHLREAAGETPVVLVTAYRIADVAEYAARGFRAVLLKPFDLDQLLAVVERYIPPAKS